MQKIEGIYRGIYACVYEYMHVHICRDGNSEKGTKRNAIDQKYYN